MSTTHPYTMAKPHFAKLLEVCLLGAHGISLIDKSKGGKRLGGMEKDSREGLGD
jgi:hypothetical protein